MSIRAPSRRQLEVSGNTTLDQLVQWSSTYKLTFSPEKTQVMSFHGLGAPALLPIFEMGGNQLAHCSKIKYLGVVIDNRLSWLPHFQAVRSKVDALTQSISQYAHETLGNSGSVLRHIYKRGIEHIIVFAAGDWWKETGNQKLDLKLRSIQRIFALRVTKAYRTTSTDALLVLARLPPVDLVAGQEATIFRSFSVGIPTTFCSTSIQPIQLAKSYAIWSDHPAARLAFAFPNITPTNSWYEIFTDGSKSVDGDDCAFVVYWQGVEYTAFQYPLNIESDIFAAQMIAIWKALEWVKSEGLAYVNIKVHLSKTF